MTPPPPKKKSAAILSIFRGNSICFVSLFMSYIICLVEWRQTHNIPFNCLSARMQTRYRKSVARSETLPPAWNEIFQVQKSLQLYNSKSRLYIWPRYSQ